MLGRSHQRDPRGQKWLFALADRLTPKRVFRDYNYAVLDFTMKICTPRNPSCEICPLVAHCSFGTDALRRSRAGTGAHRKRAIRR
ncbi:MAG: hypothetical protein ACYC60_05245 [Thermoanaerobaculia bacterium]